MMTKEQREKVMMYNTFLMSFLVQHVEYNWGADFSKEENKEIYGNYIKAMSELNIDFNSLSKKDAKILGLIKYDEESDLWQIPLHLIRVLPENTKVYNIFSNEPIDMKNIDNDNRGGYLAYGIKLGEEKELVNDIQEEDYDIELE